MAESVLPKLKRKKENYSWEQGEQDLPRSPSFAIEQSIHQSYEESGKGENDLLSNQSDNEFRGNRT